MKDNKLLDMGGVSVLSPIDIFEIAPAEQQRRFAITFQLAIVLGILFLFLSLNLLVKISLEKWLSEPFHPPEFYYNK